MSASVAILMVGMSVVRAEPTPGIGLLIKAEDMPTLREKIQVEPWAGIYARIRKEADKALVEWPAKRAEIAPHLDKLLDLTVEFDAACKDPDARRAGRALGAFANGSMCPAAVVYLMSGDKRYADVAFDILLHMGKVNRWGWFNWSGSAMPQIHAGMYFRNVAFTLDFVWDALTDEQRNMARDIIAEKGVEPYYRLTLHSPAMGLHHLRSKNQGNNVLSGAMIACLALGNDYPQASTWLRSYIQTFHWIVTHDIGWAGQGLESGLPGYWSVSMQNLYTGAVCLNNVTGIDLRAHPGFAEATYYPMYLEATVPGVGMFTEPIDPSFSGRTGTIAAKPIELPHGAAGGPWWYDYAAHFPDTPATYFINRGMVSRNTQGDLRFSLHNCHQSGHSDLIGLLWTRPELYRPDTPGPDALFKTTDRMSMIRSGYGLGQTYLYFNGDIFLSALGEILCTTSGLAWHHKWHGHQKAETGVETEAEPLAPSMVVKRSWHDDQVSFIHTESGRSNITYYRPQGHDDCYKNYTRRDRSILYVRGQPGADYFVFVDHVAQQDPRWHGWLWQSWNNVFENKRQNYGRYRIESAHRVRLERPNADLAIEFVTPKKVAFEIEDGPGQPMTSYMYDHNVIALRALAGGYGRATGKVVVIEPADWKGKGKSVSVGGAGAPAAAYRIVGRKNLVIGQGESLNGFEVAAKLEPGARHRMSILCRKENFGVYENLAWRLDLELLAADGRKIAAGRGYILPDPYSLRDPRSLTKTTPWIRSKYVHFDVPPGPEVATIRGKLFAAEYSHPPHRITADSMLELGPITIEPVGTVERRKDETFVAVVTPLKKDAAAPLIARTHTDGATVARITRPDGAIDYLVVDAEKPVKFEAGSIVAELALVRTAVKVRSVFALSATSVVMGGVTFLHSAEPVDVSLQLDGASKILSARIGTDKPVELMLFEKSVALGAGLFVAGADLDFSPDPTGTSLASNSPASQKALAAGLKPLIDASIAERDKHGTRNLALGAKVTASGTRDPRFGPEHVIDNKTWEYPTSGRLDYTLDAMDTSPLGGYGPGKTPLFGDKMSSWPFYVPPTYWLLPYGETGWIQLELPRETPVSRVRLLNTSNAGLNDYATIKYRVELMDASGRVVATSTGNFGKLFDRPFKQAFKYPEHFSRYSATFDGMLEPGIPVPFGDGWQDVKFAPTRAKSIKVYIDSHWAIGGGLNEIQAY